MVEEAAQEGVGAGQVGGDAFAGEHAARIGRTDAGGEQTIGQRLGVHVGELIRLQAGDECGLKGLVLGMKRAVLPLLRHRLGDGFLHQPRQMGHALGQFFGRAQWFPLLAEKLGEQAGHGRTACFVGRYLIAPLAAEAGLCP